MPNISLTKQARLGSFFATQIWLGVNKVWEFILSQIGQTINGTQSGWSFGIDIAINADGDKLAISCLSNQPSYNGSFISVYSYNGSTWIQVGSNINTEANSIAINSNGNKIVCGISDVGGGIGIVRVYSYNGTSWIEELYQSQSGGTLLGTSVSINSSGDKIAVSAPNHLIDRGIVRFYSYNGSSWILSGSIVGQTTPRDSIGQSISLNESGDILLMSTISVLKVYAGLTQRGNNIPFGFASQTSINSTGTIIAAANSSLGNGIVSIYLWDGSSYNKMGQDIIGEFSGEENGSSISLNSEGNQIAIGAIKSNANGTNSGVVRIYAWNGSSWIKTQTILGSNAGDLCGHSVSSNYSGNKVAFSSLFSNNILGDVKVYGY